MTCPYCSAPLNGPACEYCGAQFTEGTNAGGPHKGVPSPMDWGDVKKNVEEEISAAPTRPSGRTMVSYREVYVKDRRSSYMLSATCLLFGICLWAISDMIGNFFYTLQFILMVCAACFFLGTIGYLCIASSYPKRLKITEKIDPAAVCAAFQNSPEHAQRSFVGSTYQTSLWYVQAIKGTEHYCSSQEEFPRRDFYLTCDMARVWEGLRAGQFITIVGTCDGTTEDGCVKMKDCLLLEAESL